MTVFIRYFQILGRLPLNLRSVGLLAGVERGHHEASIVMLPQRDVSLLLIIPLSPPSLNLKGETET